MNEPNNEPLVPQNGKQVSDVDRLMATCARLLREKIDERTTRVELEHRGLEAFGAAAVDRQLGLDAFLLEQFMADRRLGPLRPAAHDRARQLPCQHGEAAAGHRG